MNGSPIDISALRHLGVRPHRIEWFGQIYRGTTANVAVVFSPWGMDSQTGEMQSDANKRVTALIPVAFVRLFRIGDIWESGRNTGCRDISTRETFHLELQEGTVMVMPAGVPLSDDPQNLEYPLPFSVFGGHKEHTHAQCARIQLDGNSTLVVPCMELVRFYFGASGSFLKRLFSGAFALDKLFTRARLSPTTRTANIDLAEDLAGTAAATVARIAFNAQARSAAAWIVNSAVAATANKHRYYPKTTFPFHGTTDLTVDGRWIEHHGHRVFLAEQLVRCTHPFPFETLFYSTCRFPLKPKKLFSPAGSGKPDIGDSAETAPCPDTHLNEQPVSSTLQPVGISVGEEIDEAFPDLAQKKIRRIRQTTPHTPPACRVEEATELAAGDESSSSAVRAAEVMVEMEDSTFDEASIEELPSEATEMFNEALGTYDLASDDHYVLTPPISDAAIDSMRPGPYLRGDEICPRGGKKLHRVWCAMISNRGDPLERALVLIRGGISRDSNDHLVLVRVSRQGDARVEVERYCDEFARSRPSEQFQQNIVLKRSSLSAIDLYSLLRGLSVGLRRLRAGGTLTTSPIHKASLAVLNEPLISRDQMLEMLEKARFGR